MPLIPGIVRDPATAEPTGMTKAIYEAMDQVLRPSMEEGGVDKEIIQKSQEAWKQLSHAIALGVVNYLLRNSPTEEEYAEVFSSRAEDASFWDWLKAFVKVLNEWAGLENGDVLALQFELKGFFMENPTTPSQLRGIIR